MQYLPGPTSWLLHSLHQDLSGKKKGGNSIINRCFQAGGLLGSEAPYNPIFQHCNKC